MHSSGRHGIRSVDYGEIRRSRRRLPRWMAPSKPRDSRVFHTGVTTRATVSTRRPSMETPQAPGTVQSRCVSTIGRMAPTSSLIHEARRGGVSHTTGPSDRPGVAYSSTIEVSVTDPPVDPSQPRSEVPRCRTEVLRSFRGSQRGQLRAMRSAVIRDGGGRRKAARHCGKVRSRARPRRAYPGLRCRRPRRAAGRAGAGAARAVQVSVPSTAQGLPAA